MFSFVFNYVIIGLPASVCLEQRDLQQNFFFFVGIFIRNLPRFHWETLCSNIKQSPVNWTSSCMMNS